MVMDANQHQKALRLLARLNNRHQPRDRQKRPATISYRSLFVPSLVRGCGLDVKRHDLGALGGNTDDAVLVGVDASQSFAQERYAPHRKIFFIFDIDPARCFGDLTQPLNLNPLPGNQIVDLRTEVQQPTEWFALQSLYLEYNCEILNSLGDLAPRLAQLTHC
jgi:hypothetical protein